MKGGGMGRALSKDLLVRCQYCGVKFYHPSEYVLMAHIVRVHPIELAQTPGFQNFLHNAAQAAYGLGERLGKILKGES